MRKVKIIVLSLMFLSLWLAAAPASDGVTYRVDPKMKNPPIIVKFTGTVIDNISLKSHKDSLSAFLPRLTKKTLIDNVNSGYCLYSSEGKLFKLKHESTEALWNTFRNVKVSTYKIRGNAQKLNDTLLILDYVCLD